MSLKSPKERLNDKFLSISKEFKQQRLPAWKPVLTCGTALPSFFLLGLALVVIGIGLLFISSRIQEFELDYTNCWPLFGIKSCAQTLDEEPDYIGCKCWYKFELNEDFYSSVYVYYGLKNYYQSHSLYENSIDGSQLLGKIQASSDCQPFQYKQVSNDQQLPIVPCGTIANSLFNDSFRIWRHDISTNLAEEVPLIFTGISWPSDQYWYNNPNGVPLEVAYANFTNPPFWRNRHIWQLDPKNPNNNGLKNEALIVWLRIAAFPDFRKLYARVNHLIGSVYEKSLPNGHYFLEIDYNYPVISFDGSKSLIIGNTSWIGGKNIFLGIAYIVCGSLLLVMTFVLFYIYKVYGMSKSEKISITNKTPYFSKSMKRNQFFKFFKNRNTISVNINRSDVT